MSNNGKIFSTTVVLVFLVSLLILPHLTAKADSSNDSSINCKLTTISPNSNTIYVGTMPLDFTMSWAVNTVVPLMYVNMSYSIDDGPRISIPDGNNQWFNSTAQGILFHYEYVVDFPASKSIGVTNTFYDIDISALSSGAHKLTLFADGLYNLDNDFINPYDFSSSPIYFSVNYLATSATASPKPTAIPSPTPIPTSTTTLTPTQTPTVPEFSALATLPLFISLLFIAIKQRHRKTVKLN